MMIEPLSGQDAPERTPCRVRGVDSAILPRGAMLLVALFLEHLQQIAVAPISTQLAFLVERSLVVAWRPLKGRTAFFASRTTFSLTFWIAKDVRAGRTGFISENGVLVEYMRSESRSRRPSLWCHQISRISPGVWLVRPLRKAWTILAWLCSRLMSFPSPSLSRNTWKRKSEKLQFALFLIAESTMEIFAFKDSGHFRFFAEESRDPKTRRFSLEACFLLREWDAVADPCCELNIGNIWNAVEGLWVVGWAGKELGVWRVVKFRDQVEVEVRIPADGESVFSTGLEFVAFWEVGAATVLETSVA